MLFQQTQALSPHFLALRQTGSLLSWLRSLRLRAPLVAVTGKDGLKHRHPHVHQAKLRGKETLARIEGNQCPSGKESPYAERETDQHRNANPVDNTSE